MHAIRHGTIPPKLRASHLARRDRAGRVARLADWRVTLVAAPAGYGKTTLLSEWHAAQARTGARTVWLAPDAAGADARSLLAALAGQVGVAAGADALLDALAAIEGPAYLFLDLPPDLPQDAVAFLSGLIRKAPDNTHVVLAARNPRVIDLGELRAYGLLDEVGPEQLALSPEEAVDYLRGLGFDASTRETLHAVMDRTEGWITGLSLIGRLAEPRPGAVAGPDLLTGRHRAVADYFGECVLATESAELREFLLLSAALLRPGPEICDAVLGRTDSAEMLRRVESRGLFLSPVGPEESGWRYHPLFSEYLNRCFEMRDPAAAHALHMRAADWLVANRRPVEAMDHLIAAGETMRLARLLEAEAEQLSLSGKFLVVEKYAANLPREVLDRSPWILLTLAWLRIHGLQYDESRDLLDAATRHIGGLRASGEASAESLEALEQSLRHREMALQAARDNVLEVSEPCRTLASYFSRRSPYTMCTIYNHLMMSRRETFRFDDVEQLAAKARQSAEQSGFGVTATAALASSGLSLFAAGRTEAAIIALDQALSGSHRWAGRNSALAALAALPLAEIAYETNDLDRAEELADGHIPLAREYCFVDQFMAGHLTRVRLHASRGDLAAARTALDDTMNIALECNLERLRVAVILEQVRLLLRNAMPDAASLQAAQAGIQIGDRCNMPQPKSTTCDDRRAEIWARMAMTQDRVADALNVARQWRSFAQSRQAVRSFVRWSILAAQMNMVDGNARAAQRAMREAITVAAPARLLRSFIDEGVLIQTILSATFEDKVDLQHPADRFAQEVLAAFGSRATIAQVEPVSDPGLYGRLSAKELEILTLVGFGLRNREIGNRLGLTEGSVKWYMQQVYDKVGIRRRSQAVERARKFGLIA
jgi:LuxR family maltose regulon positive regulatory protein